MVDENASDLVAGWMKGESGGKIVEEGCWW
jgi:hypothetical protein